MTEKSLVQEIDDANDEENILSESMTHMSKMNVLMAWNNPRSWYFWHAWFNEEELNG